MDDLQGDWHVISVNDRKLLKFYYATFFFIYMYLSVTDSALDKFM